MGFRDEEVAARSRAESLEQRVAELEAENERLRAGRSSARRTLSWAPWVVVGVAVLLFGASLYSGFVVSGYVGEQVGIALGLGASVALFTGIAGAVLGALLEIGQPHELLVISGRQRYAPDGSVLGYRIVHGGRVIRVPLLERVERLDLTPVRLELSLRDVPVRDARISIEGWARVKISAEPRRSERAVERFLGRDRAEIADVARDVLEGVTRDVLADLDPSMISETEKLHERLRDFADDELGRLGLELDHLRLVTG